MASQEREIEKPIIGIDLGTSTSAIAVMLDGRPELIQDANGDRIVPSIVQILPEGEALVGSPAKHGAVSAADRTAQEVKRLMGTGEMVKIGNRLVAPEEIASKILIHLRQAAANRLGTPIADVVISVPARFENDAREATKKAAELAGLNVLRLINEPTAAALAYGLDRLDNNQKILVFDFGGGTLDVTILEMFEGVLDVKTSVGDDKLGGKDVDDILQQVFRDGYKEQTGKKLPPPSRDKKTAQILKEQAEQYKKILSSAPLVQVEIPNLTADGGLSMTLKRKDLEDKLEPLLTRAMTLVNGALGRARLNWEQIDVVLPIGGASRMPLFRRALEMCWGRPIQEFENPDEAVAKGAAIAASIEQRRQDEEAKIIILDVAPHRLGVATIKQVGAGQFIEDYFSEIIPKDSKLPTQERRQYATSFDNSGEPIPVRIYEANSDSNVCREHRLVAELPLRRIDGFREGTLVEVDFRYTMDGTLEAGIRYQEMPAIQIRGKFSVGNAGSKKTAEESYQSELASAAAAAALSNGDMTALWQTSELAQECMPLLEQVDRMAQGMPQNAPRLTAAADALRCALASGDKEEVQRNIEAVADLIMELM